MSDAILIETPFASATQTAKILGVSKSRKLQLVKMLKLNRLGSRGSVRASATGSIVREKRAKGNRWLVTGKSEGKSKAMNGKRRLSNKRHASTKTNSSGTGNSSH